MQRAYARRSNFQVHSDVANAQLGDSVAPPSAGLLMANILSSQESLWDNSSIHIHPTPHICHLFTT